MSNIASSIRQGCISLLRRFPTSSDIVANILEQVEGGAEVTLVKPTRHLTRRPRILRSHKTTKSDKVKRPMQRIQKATKMPRRKPVTFDVSGPLGQECLIERHAGRTVFKISKSQFDSVCSAILDGCTGTTELTARTGMKDHLVHTALRFLKSQDLMLREKNKYIPTQFDNWNERAVAAWDSVRKPEQLQQVSA